MTAFATDWKLGTAAGNDNAVGTYAWIDPINVTNTSDAQVGGRVYSTMYIDSAGEKFVARTAKLIINGAIVGTSQASNDQFGAGTNVRQIGGSSNLWGNTIIRVPEAKDASFGVAFSMARLSSSNVLTGQTQYIDVSGFNFDIPTGATITGVQIEVYANIQYAGPGINYGELYYIKMRVHYDLAIVLDGTGVSDAYIKINEQPEPQIPQEKSYQYLSYENNEFRGQWKDVESIPSIKIDINKLPGELSVELARNLESKETEYEEILLSGYGGAELLVTTQNRETILAGEETAYGIGSGTDLEVDHYVRIKEYYGGYEPLLTSGNINDVILTSQGEPIVISNGYPRGRMYYQGYVSDFGLIYDADKQNTSVKLMHLSDELNNETYKTPDTLKIDTIDTNNFNSIPFGGFFKFSGDILNAGHTFTADASYDLKRMVYRMSGWRDNIITLTLRTGSTIGAGTVIGTATAQITAAGVNVMSFAFADTIAITNATVYNVTFESQFEKQTGSQSHPASVYMGNSYANGTSYYTQDGINWTATTDDIGFQTWQNGGNTRVNELSIDPSQIMRKVLDYNKTVGGLITYDKASIDSSFTVVSAPFNVNTLKESADYVLKLTPSNWFYYIDPGELLFNLHGQPSLVTQWFTLKKDIIKLELHKNIEKIINQVLFTGGGTPTPLFREYVDIASRNQWRKGLAKLSDNRVTDPTTADLLMQAAANEVSQPIWIGTLEVLRAEHPKFVRPGELAGFRGFGNLIDLLNVQIVSVNVTPDTFVIELGTQIPKQSQRIEDIKRNLTRLEIENNPNAPA